MGTQICIKAVWACHPCCFLFQAQAEVDSSSAKLGRKQELLGRAIEQLRCKGDTALNKLLLDAFPISERFLSHCSYRETLQMKAFPFGASLPKYVALQSW